MGPASPPWRFRVVYLERNFEIRPKTGSRILARCHTVRAATISPSTSTSFCASSSFTTASCPCSATHDSGVSPYSSLPGPSSLHQRHRAAQVAALPPIFGGRSSCGSGADVVSHFIWPIAGKSRLMVVVKVEGR